jgi:hypothetical protein
MSLSLSIYHTSSYQWNKLMPSSHISTAAVINSRCRFRWGPVFWRLSWPAWIGHPVHLHICPRQMWLEFFVTKLGEESLIQKNGYAKYTILLYNTILYNVHRWNRQWLTSWHPNLQLPKSSASSQASIIIWRIVFLYLIAPTFCLSK